MQKRESLEFWWSEKGGLEKKIMLILLLKIESMIFCGIDAHFPLGKRGPWKFFVVQKGGPEIIVRVEIFCIPLASPTLQVFVDGP